MNDGAMFFSILFFFVCSVSVFFGIYIMSVNPKAGANGLFLATCLALGVWSFAYSIAISAPDQEIAVRWYHISSVGWGSMFSFLVHFLLKLTERGQWLRKWWTYLLLYVPVAVNIIVFSIPNSINENYFNLISTRYGWIDQGTVNVWTWFHTTYYTVFVLFGFWLIWSWGKRMKAFENSYGKSIKLILYSYLSALVLGILSDFVFTALFPTRIPQLATVIILIPVIFIYYAVKHNEWIAVKYTYDSNAVITEATQDKIFYYLSIAAVTAGLMNFAVQYLIRDNGNFTSVLFTSVFLILLGLKHPIIQRMNMNGSTKNIINVMAVCLVIPLVTLQFIGQASITVWAFPFILFIISLVFSKRTLILFSISTILTQVIVWILTPYKIVEITSGEHFIRVGLFVIAIFLAFFVNRVYSARLKKDAEQIRFQKLVTDISSDFVSVDQHNIDDKMNSMLKQIGEFVGVDRSYLFFFNFDNDTMACTHEWCNEGIEPQIDLLQNLPLDAYPWWMNQILNNGVVNISFVEELPPEAEHEKELLEEQSIKSLLSIPITGKEKVMGFIGLDVVEKHTIWQDIHRTLLRIITNTLADALTKIEAQKEINDMAFFDHLTKLPNRQLFRDRTEQAIEHAKRTGKKLGIIFLDLDSFKNVNDTMGHEGGDELLINVSRALRQSVRGSDTVSRFGGDEFLILVNDISTIDDVIVVADKIVDLFNKPFMLKGQEFFVTASAGIAIYPYDGQDTEMLIKNADIAMYDAKSKGKNRYVVCSSEMKSEVERRMMLTNSLYRALERNELVLHYQPQVSLQPKKIIGLEALLRWHHPEWGTIGPDIFIPLAEHTGLINPIGEWVLRAACSQNKAWQDKGLKPLRMAVNVSIHQLRNPAFVSRVEEIIKSTGLAPEYLELEITESGAVNEPGYIIDILNDLKRLGVSISIDDFGTEYSSLSRLKMLPIDRIKMDMQFVHGIEGTDKDKAITKVIIHLARNLGLKVIAEGVETETQLEFLSQKMCDEVQGFYYYKPMPADKVEAVLKEFNHWE